MVPVAPITTGITLAFTFHMRRISLLLLLLLLLSTANWFIPGGSILDARQDNTIQYSTIQYNTVQHDKIAHITQNNIQHSKQLSIRKITKRNQEHILYSIKTQKRLETKVDESVLKTTHFTKQSVKQRIE
jgi:uncharacterized ion transporter superfamily protein YfcC